MNSALCTATSSALTAPPPTPWPLWVLPPCTKPWAASACCKPYMRPVYAGAQVSGTAVTVLLHPGDNWMLHVVAEQIQPGDIVVAAITADCTDGYFGDLLATSFHGARRPCLGDRRRRARRAKSSPAWAFPVWSRAISSQGHGQGHAGLGEYSGGVRRHARQRQAT